jgi:hypothetical protein
VNAPPLNVIGRHGPQEYARASGGLDQEHVLHRFGAGDFGQVDGWVRSGMPRAMRDNYTISHVGATEGGVSVEVRYTEGGNEGVFRLIIPEAGERGTAPDMSRVVQEAVANGIQGSRLARSALTGEGETGGQSMLALVDMISHGQLQIDALPEFMRPAVASARDRVLEARRNGASPESLLETATAAAGTFRRDIGTLIRTNEAARSYYDRAPPEVKAVLEREARAAEEQGAPAQPAPATAEQETRVFMVDTCYIIRKLESGASLLDTFRRLSQNGEVVIVGQVYEEVMRNLPMFNSRVRAQAIADLGQARGEGLISIENVQLSQSFLDGLSTQMGDLSVKGNRRVGAGEAAMARYVQDVARGLFDRVVVLSEDSDVPLLLRGSDIHVTSDYRQ